jgi:hypothetical protein
LQCLNIVQTFSGTFQTLESKIRVTNFNFEYFAVAQTDFKANETILNLNIAAVLEYENCRFKKISGN